MPKYFCTTKTPGSITYKNSIDSGCFSKDRASFFSTLTSQLPGKNYPNTSYCIFYFLSAPMIKVIIEKSRGEVSPLGQDTIENVSYSIENLKFFFFRFCMFLMCHIGQKIYKL